MAGVQNGNAEEVVGVAAGLDVPVSAAVGREEDGRAFEPNGPDMAFIESGDAIELVAGAAARLVRSRWCRCKRG